MDIQTHPQKRFHRLQKRQPLVVMILLFISIILIGRFVLSVGVSATSAIGAHTPLVEVKKSENPQNLMVVYTKLNPTTCRFETISGHPVFDEYWLMDGVRYKRVHPLIKSAVSDRFELDQAIFNKDQRFLVHLKDFNELKSDLGRSPAFEVTTSKAADGAKTSDGTCRANVTLELGPSDQHRKISIESIYADSSKTLVPPFRKLNSLTLNGHDVATGAEVHRTYQSERR